MFHFHSIHFLGLFAKSYPQYMTFWKCQYFPLLFLKSLPTVNYLNITKFRKEEILPSRNSSFSCKHAYVFVTSQPKIFVLVCKVSSPYLSSLKYKSAIIGEQRKLGNIKSKWGYEVFVITELFTDLSLPLTLPGWLRREKTCWLSTITSGRIFPLWKKLIKLDTIQIWIAQECLCDNRVNIIYVLKSTWKYSSMSWSRK